MPNSLNVNPRGPSPNSNSIEAAANFVLLVVAANLINEMIFRQTQFRGSLHPRPIMWRENTNRNDERQRLIRYDRRGPNIIFQYGFNTRNTLIPATYSWDLERYVLGVYDWRITPYVSTSRSTQNPNSTWNEWTAGALTIHLDPGQSLYVYEIFAPGGIEINQTFGTTTSIDEITFVGGIRREFIRSARELQIVTDAQGRRFTIVRYYHNPRFRYVPELNLPPSQIPKDVEVVLWKPTKK